MYIFKFIKSIARSQVGHAIRREEKNTINKVKNLIMYFSKGNFMLYPFVCFIFFTSCTALPQLYQAAEDIADDNAIKVEISREAITKQTDVRVVIDVKNNPEAANQKK